METGVGCFELYYDFGTAKKFHIGAAINAYLRVTGGAMREVWGGPQIATQDHFPVIQSVRHITPDIVEIRRRLIHKRFHNHNNNDGDSAENEEIIFVNRAAMGSKTKVALDQTLIEPGVKTEGTKVTGTGYLVKRCLLDEKVFEAISKRKGTVQMFSDVFMYKNLRMLE